MWPLLSYVHTNIYKRKFKIHFQSFGACALDNPERKGHTDVSPVYQVNYNVIQLNSFHYHLLIASKLRPLKHVGFNMRSAVFNICSFVRLLNPYINTLI